MKTIEEAKERYIKRFKKLPLDEDIRTKSSLNGATVWLFPCDEDEYFGRKK